jgi:hypothetical protein
MDFRKLMIGVAATAVAITATFAAPAWGQAAPTYTVTKTTGDVIVLRGNQVFTLREGDVLKEGDKVFTRTQASAVIQQVGTCSLPLPAASAVDIPTSSGAACTLTKEMVTSLSPSTTIAGVTIGSGGFVAGAALPVIGTLAALSAVVGVTASASP